MKARFTLLNEGFEECGSIEVDVMHDNLEVWAKFAIPAPRPGTTVAHLEVRTMAGWFMTRKDIGPYQTFLGSYAMDIRWSHKFRNDVEREGLLRRLNEGQVEPWPYKNYPEPTDEVRRNLQQITEEAIALSRHAYEMGLVVTIYQKPFGLTPLMGRSVDAIDVRTRRIQA